MKVGFSIILLLVGLVLHSQKTEFDSTYVPDKSLVEPSANDSIFYLDLGDKLTVKLLVERRNHLMSISDSNGQGRTVFQPNNALTLGLGVNYKFFGLAATFIPINSRDKEKYGTTKRLDIQSNIYTRRFGFDVRINYHKGFYVDNAGSLSTIPIHDDYLSRPDIQSFSLGTDFFYIFNGGQFSFQSVFTNTHWQQKSAGTFFAGTRFLYFDVQGDTLLGPVGITPINPDSYSERINTYSLGLIGGYAYNLIIKKYFYISGALGPSLSFVGGTSTAQNGTTIEPQERERVGYTLRAGFGFNSKKYFAGVSIFIDDAQLQYANLQHERQLFRFFMGMRFF